MWALLFLALPQIGWALTPSGVLIANQASVDFVVGPSPTLNTLSDTVQLLVDKKIDLRVQETTGAATLVQSPQAGAVTSFKVTNLGNDAQGFIFVAAVAVGNPAPNGIAPFATNNFNAVLGANVFVDFNGNGTYEPLIDTATSIPNLAAGATSSALFVIGDIGVVADGQQSVVSFTATAVATDGTALSATLGADTLMGLDTVFADNAGVVDVVRDGKHSDYAAYLASAVDVMLTKTIISVLPIGGSAVLNPASGDIALRPGSVITYQIEAIFFGAGTVNTLVINDPIPASTTYVPNSITVDGVAKTDTPADADNADFTSNTVTVMRNLIAVPAANIVVRFQATIN